MKDSPYDLKVELKHRLEWFIFFHLGSDAELDIRDREDKSLKIAVRHRRVEPFEFTLGEAQAITLLDDPQDLEAFLLDQLTRHRR